MKKLFGIALAATWLQWCGALEASTVPSGNVIPRLVQGGGWSTEIQVLNTNDQGSPMPYRIDFFDETGRRLDVVVQGVGVDGGISAVSGVVPYRGVHLLTLPNIGSLRSGYAVIESLVGDVVVSSVLTQTVAGRPDFQMTVPSLSQYSDKIRMVFKNGRPFTTAIALTSAESQRWIFRVFTVDGFPACQKVVNMERGQHLAVILGDFLGCTIGQQGLLEIEADFVGGTVVGIVAHDFGPFTVQIPHEICCPF